jgi:hypothetical protein
MIDKDVTIMYQGGSGGFALYYYLLLSEKYKTGLEYNRVEDLIQQQFPAGLSVEQKKWKTFEHWPDNLKCKQNNSGPRLYLICNPLFNPDMFDQNMFIAQDTFKILLHTNIHIQLRMAWDKTAYWFTDVSRQVFNAPPNDQEYLRWILKHSEENLKLNSIKEKFKPDLTLQLQDFVNTQCIPGFDPPTAQQQEFLNYWFELQSAKAKYLLKRKGP